MNTVYQKTIDLWGMELQLKMAIEESAELIGAIIKYMRGRVGKDAVINEIADVKIMIRQLEYIFGESDVALKTEQKLTRLMMMVNKEKKG